MDVQELIDKCNEEICNRQDLAEKIGVDYVYFTRFLKGHKVGAKTLQKIQEYYE
jgi:hypothetical protein